MMGRWAVTCKECGLRHTWTGPQFPVPGCPKCKPAKAKGKAESNTLDASDIDQDQNIREAHEQCNRIIEMAEEVPDPGIDFAIGVAESTEGIRDTIQKTQRVTRNQQEALDNMEFGLTRWLKH